MGDVPDDGPPGEGWNLFTCFPPFYLLDCGHVVELWRREWGNTTGFMNKATSPGFNVADLWWREA